MPAPNTITVDKLIRLIGTPKCPVLVDLRSDEEFALAPALIPTARRRRFVDLVNSPPQSGARSVVVLCQDGLSRSHGVAAWLRHLGQPAETLEGGWAAWQRARMPMVAEAKLPPRDAHARTVWVTRARPKVDRIACPWLIRRFVDREAIFLFVAPSEVMAVAQEFGAAPFDVQGAFWSHRNETCSFDTMLDEFGLDFEPLRRLATIVRGADTARPDLAPEAAGLLAASLGLSRMYPDDLEQLEAGMLLYDAFYRWCRDATAEKHDLADQQTARGK